MEKIHGTSPDVFEHWVGEYMEMSLATLEALEVDGVAQILMGKRDAYLLRQAIVIEALRRKRGECE